MSGGVLAEAGQVRLHELLELRSDANRRFFAAESERLARLCPRMAERFARGGRLIALAASPPAFLQGSGTPAASGNPVPGPR